MNYMNMAKLFNHLSSINLLPFPHRRLFVDPGHTLDQYGLDHTLLTLAAAEEAAIANQNDEVCIIPGSSSLTLTAALTWDKNYTHLVGACAPTMVGQRARIFQLATLTAASPLLDITASGCIMSNFYIFQGVNDATSLINVEVSGGRNYFENVHFAGGGHATQAVDGGASLKLDGAAECTFDRCTIGVDTIAAGTGMVGLLIDTDAKRDIFRNCNFTMYAGHTGAAFVEVADSAGFDRYILFDNCNLINDAVAYTMASAFVIPSGMGSATHRILLKDCMLAGVTTVDANDRGIVYGNMNAVTAADLSGVAVLMNV